MHQPDEIEQATALAAGEAGTLPLAWQRLLAAPKPVATEDHGVLGAPPDLDLQGLAFGDGVAALAAQAAFANYFLHLTRIQYLQLETYFPIATALGLPESCCIPGYEDPLNRLLVEASACENASKISFCFSIGMPIPVSRTTKRRQTRLSSLLKHSTRRTTAPRSVNLSALLRRFKMT